MNFGHEIMDAALVTAMRTLPLLPWQLPFILTLKVLACLKAECKELNTVGLLCIP
jgi:hypothetical protein